MCGISGLVGSAAESDLGEAMIRSLAHRGPDATGRYVERGRVFLGHNRLAILDPEHGQQPMASEDGALRLVHNGEIYNFPELRRELEQKGHRFRTTSDTEA